MMEEFTRKFQIIPRGALLTISAGAYSDYCVNGVFRALADIDASALLAEWLNQNPKQLESYGFEPAEFLSWVAVTKRLLEPLDSYEWHLTDYWNHGEMDVSDSTKWEGSHDQHG